MSDMSTEDLQVHIDVPCEFNQVGMVCQNWKHWIPKDPKMRDPFELARLDAANAQTETVDELIDGRVGVYGDPVKTYARVAEIWSGILGTHVNATDVALCMVGLKLLRTQVTPDYSDNSDDIEGYLDIFRKIVGDDMVHARSVTEYLEQRNAR